MAHWEELPRSGDLSIRAVFMSSQVMAARRVGTYFPVERY